MAPGGGGGAAGAAVCREQHAVDVRRCDDPGMMVGGPGIGAPGNNAGDGIAGTSPWAIQSGGPGGAPQPGPGGGHIAHTGVRRHRSAAVRAGRRALRLRVPASDRCRCMYFGSRAQASGTG